MDSRAILKAARAVANDVLRDLYPYTVRPTGMNAVTIGSRLLGLDNPAPDRAAICAAALPFVHAGLARWGVHPDNCRIAAQRHAYPNGGPA